VHLGVNQKLLFEANENVIKIVDINVDLKDGETKEISYTPDKIQTYVINQPNRLLGFFENGFSRNDSYILCAIEVEDNQIDFTRMYIWERNYMDKSQI